MVFEWRAQSGEAEGMNLWEVRMVSDRWAE